MHRFSRKALLEREALGEVAEWSIAAVLKTVVLRGTRGSNPCLSAINIENQCFTKQTPDFTPKNVKSGVLYLELPDFIFARIVVISTQPQGFPNNLLIP